MINQLEFGNLSKAWAGINKFLFLEAEAITAAGGGEYGPEFVSYNNYVIIKRAWVDPEFNFGKVLGYTYKKWSALVNNYVDYKYLDLIRAEIAHRTGRNARSYNYSFHFNNAHGSGKDCLISLLFTKRLGIPHPVLVFQVRTSEVTKRLIFDFLLIQRISEYIYGHNDVEVHFFAPSFYITGESFVIFNNVEPIKKMLRKYRKKHKETHPEHHVFQTKTLKIFDDYMNHPDPKSIRYKVHRRSAMQIRRQENGRPLSNVKDLFAKQLLLKRDIEDLPKEVISKSQLKAHNKLKRNGNPTISKLGNKENQGKSLQPGQESEAEDLAK